MHITPLVWIVTIVVLLAILIADAVIVGRRPHVPSARECLAFVVLYVALAIAFGIGLHVFAGQGASTQFFAGWLTEYSLSIDNLFVFLLLMAKFHVPRESQQFGLLIGIMLALVFRGVFIGLGAALVSNLAWVFVIFGGWLLYTAYGLVRDHVRGESEQDEAGDTADQAADSRLMGWVKRVVPATNDFQGDKLWVKQGGRRLATSLFFVVVALGTTDVMFALDSIPAIYGLTDEPYIVFTANVFALMGLRQLYFLLGNLLKKLVYLSLGLAVLLGFIGVKLVLHAAHHYGLDSRMGFNGEISTEMSLIGIVAILLVTVAASLLKSRADRRVGAQ